MSGFVTRGAWRSMEASEALIAKCVSQCGGSTFALVGKNPRRAKPSPPSIKTRSVTMMPRKNLPIISYFGRRVGQEASFDRVSNRETMPESVHDIRSMTAEYSRRQRTSRRFHLRSHRWYRGLPARRPLPTLPPHNCSDVAQRPKGKTGLYLVH